MAIKKSELYSSLWAGCDELRGSMDASQYKDYVLVLLFMKYVSDKGGALVDIPEGGSFKDMVKLKGHPEIGDNINKIIGELARANDLTGVITVADFNDDEKLGKGKEKVDRLSNLIEIFEKPELDFSSNRAEGDDLLGDAYEYLMRHFATESGKSKGQFYTPAEVSRIMAKVISINTSKSQSETLAVEQQAIDDLQAQAETLNANMEEMREEHGGEDGLLSNAMDDKGKISKKNLQAAIKNVETQGLVSLFDDAGTSPDNAEEYDMLQAYKKLIDDEAKIKTEIKKTTAELEILIIKKYPTLSINDIKTIVVDKKWMHSIEQRIRSEMDNISHRLTQRIKELAERYDTPLPQVEDEVNKLTARVDEHLKRMGFVK